jgi:hypothetical protein
LSLRSNLFSFILLSFLFIVIAYLSLDEECGSLQTPLITFLGFVRFVSRFFYDTSDVVIRLQYTFKFFFSFLFSHCNSCNPFNNFFKMLCFSHTTILNVAYYFLIMMCTKLYYLIIFNFFLIVLFY